MSEGALEGRAIVLLGQARPDHTFMQSVVARLQFFVTELFEGETLTGGAALGPDI